MLRCKPVEPFEVCGCEKLQVITSTQMSAHKVGSARTMVCQQLHEPVRASNAARYSSEDMRTVVIIELGWLCCVAENVTYDLNQWTV